MNTQSNQRGYINIDFTAVFISLIAFGAIVGIGGYKLWSWAWPYIKQLIIWSLT